MRRENDEIKIKNNLNCKLLFFDKYNDDINKKIIKNGFICFEKVVFKGLIVFLFVFWIYRKRV